MPATLEALLALRPPPAQSWAPAVQGQATPPRDDTLAIAPDALVLLLHAGPPDSAQAQVWAQRLLAGVRLRQMPLHAPDVLEQLQHHPPQAVLIHFAPGALAAATALATGLQANQPQLLRVAVGLTRDPACMLAALRAGVQDFLDLDAPLSTSRHTLQALLSRTPPDAAGAADAPQAPLTALVSARAGLGCSLLATHLAWYLQQRLQEAAAPDAGGDQEAGADALHALLLDLGQPGGDCALYLGAPSEFDFVQAASQPRRFDRRMAQSALAHHSSGLRLLALPRPYEGQPPEVSAADAQALLQRLRQHFHHVVADLGTFAASRLALQVASQASQLWLVCEQSVASVVASTALLRRLEAQQIPRERLGLIISRHDGQLELEAAQIARQLQLPLLAVVPERRRELARAFNQGRLLQAQQREPYVQALHQLLERLPAIPAAVARPAGAPAASALARFLQRLLRR